MIEIKELEPTRANLRRFTKFQIDLYRDNPWYVPPLINDDVNTLDPAATLHSTSVRRYTSWPTAKAGLWGV